MKTRKTIALAVIVGSAGLAAAGCASIMKSWDDTDAKALALMRASFKENGQAKLDRLNQDEVQRLCSEYVEEKKMPREVAERIERGQMATIKYPAKLVGDWKAGERIAQTGVGMQFSDTAGAATGGNCYACHQLTKAELSFGTIGPPLYNFAKIRGFTPATEKYAYGKIYNSEAYSACSSMPRFGHMGILTEKQMQDVTALLMDPESPVNK
jgi:sulfur-oxidizing protein SoxX